MKIEPIEYQESMNAMNRGTQGRLYLTNYRIIFAERSGTNKWLEGTYIFYSIPIMSVNNVKQISSSYTRQELHIKTKLLRHIVLSFENQEAACVFVYSFLQHLLDIHSLENVFAFSYKAAERNARTNFRTFNQWRHYDPTEEYRRMGVDDRSSWAFTDVNTQYALCPTYPEVLCVPASVTSKELASVATFRSKKRIPVLSWKNPKGHQSICRSSQPLVGMQGAKSETDQKLVRLIGATNPDSEWFHICDARPKANAIGNKVTGAGYEEAYPSSLVHFMNIDNIHEMSASMSRLFRLIRNTMSDPTTESEHWLTNLESTRWPQHIMLLLSASSDMVDILEVKMSSVLVHCSDSWDRTPQLTSLTSLMLDPYYRTIKGFIVLIEKEWLSFGHNFAQRNFGLVKGNKKKNMISPIFLQFMDTVYQLKTQFPLSFEFTSNLLLFLVDACYDCKFGTFLYDCEKDRVTNLLFKTTECVWDQVLAHPEIYSDPAYRHNSRTLRISPTMRRYNFWRELYCRYDELSKPHEQIEQYIQILLENNRQLKSKLNKANKAMEIEQKNYSNKLRMLTREPSKGFVLRQANTNVNFVIDDILNRACDIIAQKRFQSKELKQSSLEKSLRKDSLGNIRHPKWMPDGAVSFCHQCRVGFNLFKRKHHCRCCGEIFCNLCTQTRRAIPQLNMTFPVRICDPCNVQLTKEEEEKTAAKGNNPAAPPSQTFEVSMTFLDTQSGHLGLNKGKTRTLTEWTEQYSSQTRDAFEFLD
eukprot:TRINITY_DN6621_c0_g2_i1.p1 TRINITY_DN6621_c0_g2~~TRINITY_DN6621_c0_g2_i1.p1  ORF type:complete len:800 (-),score=128.31 TRINITY_DN6621_c0_g2_i1:6-2273(-)